MKKCTFCAEEIQDEAIKCKHCGSWLDGRSSQAEPPTIAEPPRIESKPSPGVKTANSAAAVSGLGCLIVVLGLILVCFWLLSSQSTPRSETKPKPSDTYADLSAGVIFTGTQFLITNKDRTDWTDVKLEINGGFLTGGFEMRTARIKAGDVVTVGAMQFAKSDGTRFNPFQMKPQKFVISAKVGSKNGIYVGGWQ